MTIKITFTQNTILKLRPLPSTALIRDEKADIFAGSYIKVEEPIRPRLENGHLYVVLSQADDSPVKLLSGKSGVYFYPPHTDFKIDNIPNSDRKPASSYISITPAATELMQYFEGYETTCYKCPAGVPTVGYGHTDPSLEVGRYYSDAECIRFWQQDIKTFIDGVGEIVTVPLTAWEFSALVSFAYNSGLQALSSSTLLRRLNGGDYQAPKTEFPRWVYGGGFMLPGLVTRRAAESILFYTGKFYRP